MKARIRVVAYSILGILAIAALAFVALTRGGSLREPTNHAAIQVVNPVDIQMVDSNHGWIVTKSRVLHTKADGSWVNATPAGAAQLQLSSLSVVGSDTAWLAVAEGEGISSPVLVYHTTNGGQDWLEQTPGTIGSPDIHFNDSQQGWLFVHKGQAAGSESVALLGTIDGGATWELLTQAPADSSQANPMPLGGGKTGLTMVDSQVGWLTGYDYGPDLYLYHTTDGGRTWTQQSLAAPQGYTVGGGSGVTYPPRFFDELHGVLPVTISEQQQTLVFYLTSDGGKAWEAQRPVTATGEGRFQYSIVDRTQLMASDGKTLFASSDGGQTWQTVELVTSLAGLSRLEFVSPQVGWAIIRSDQDGSSRLLQTSDGGHTWKTVQAVQ